MLTKRIIPCLDVRDGRLTKGIKFKGNVDIGDPVETAAFYYAEGADEIINVRIETCAISQNSRRGTVGSIEVYAYGTALKYG